MTTTRHKHNRQTAKKQKTTFERHQQCNNNHCASAAFSPATEAHDA